jgi:hypothetical protein
VKSSLLFIALMLHLLSASADPLPLVTINDPAGDDFGAGTLTYPQRADFQTGDLDILALQISRDAEGVWFEAKFKNPIRNPANIPNGVGNESLADFARQGFYQFNLDIYIDTDRANGSGNTFTLPGRQVRIAPHFAWERAVILTPRPELMRGQLLGALEEQFPKRTSAEIEASVDQAIIFPTRIRIHGKSISFFVPAGFFPETDVTAWAATAFVTGAITIIPADFSLLNSGTKPLQRLQLGVMQPAPGHPKNAFGYTGDLPSPVVDLLGATAGQQAQLLAANNELTGVALGTDINSTVAASVTNTMSGTSAVPIGIFFQPESLETAKPSEASPPPANPATEPSIAKRLQTLQQLFDQKLIDETEYKQQKQRILKEL